MTSRHTKGKGKGKRSVPLSESEESKLARIKEISKKIERDKERRERAREREKQKKQREEQSDPTLFSDPPTSSSGSEPAYKKYERKAEVQAGLKESAEVIEAMWKGQGIEARYGKRRSITRRKKSPEKSKATPSAEPQQEEPMDTLVLNVDEEEKRQLESPGTSTTQSVDPKTTRRKHTEEVATQEPIASTSKGVISAKENITLKDYRQLIRYQNFTKTEKQGGKGIRYRISSKLYPHPWKA